MIASTNVLTIQGQDLSGSPALLLILVATCFVLWMLISIVIGQIRKKKLLQQLQSMKHKKKQGRRSDTDDEYSL